MASKIAITPAIVYMVLTITCIYINLSKQNILNYYNHNLFQQNEQ